MDRASSGRGTLFVLSAPSGTGKSTLARALLAGVEGLEFSVSHTTRPRRAGETDGVDYHFVDRPAFESMIESGALLEWADVFGELYGTGRERTRQGLDAGRDLLLDIDVQGARQVRAAGVEAVTIMLLPPDFGTLERRLRGRGSDASRQVQSRLALARREAEAFREFDYVVVNDAVEPACETLVAIVRAERHRSRRASGEVERILATFPV